VTAFDDAFVHVVGIEGRYSNDPKDSGGATMYGITERKARAHGYTGNMRDLPLATAKAIYKTDFWDYLQLDTISFRAPSLAAELFDSAVNCGATAAAQWLQRALNGLNLQGSLFADMPVDCHVGAVTVAAFDALWLRRNGAAETALRRLCDCQQGCYYLGLSLGRPKDESFLFGWIISRVGSP
jgi:lysozyme family protein